MNAQSSAGKDAYALQEVLIRWEREGESNEILGSPADLYEQARFILSSEWWELLHDELCDALMAARHGKYDGRTVESHLERLVERTRPLTPADGGTP